MTVVTVNLRLALILSLIILRASAQSGTQRTVQKSRPPAQMHDSMKTLIRAFDGSWVIHLSSDGSQRDAKVSAGSGEEIWRAGPGSNSLIEEYHSTGTEGEISGVGIFWREVGEKGFKVFWCDNTALVACRTLHNKADWKEGRLVLSDERYEKGKKRIFQEIFAFDTPDSFVQTLAEGESGDSPPPFLTIRATRRKP